MTRTERDKALKLLDAITSECDTQVGYDHGWRECRACLGREELDQAGPRQLLRKLYEEWTRRHTDTQKFLREGHDD